MGILKNTAIGLDQTLNCLVRLTDGWGMPDEMLSSRAWRLRADHPRLHAWIDRLFFWDEYYIRKAGITVDSNLNLDFSSFGPIPYTIPELSEEAMS